MLLIDVGLCVVVGSLVVVGNAPGVVVGATVVAKPTSKLHSSVAQHCTRQSFPPSDIPLQNVLLPLQRDVLVQLFA